jgi:biotin operon repressor
MNYAVYRSKVTDMEYYIRSGIAKNVEELEKRLNMPRRSVLRMIDHLKETGVNIKYSRRLSKYIIEK